jgi:hypothetical protein
MDTLRIEVTLQANNEDQNIVLLSIPVDTTVVGVSIVPSADYTDSGKIDCGVFWIASSYLPLGDGRLGQLLVQLSDEGRKPLCPFGGTGILPQTVPACSSIVLHAASRLATSIKLIVTLTLE